MSPRVIHIPLSGGDRKAQAKGIRHAHGIHVSHYRQSALIRSAAEAKIREADRLECEAWNAIMWAGGPAMPSPRRAAGGAYHRQGDQRRLRPAGGQVQPVRPRLAGPAAISEAPAGDPVWKLEAALYCEPCSEDGTTAAASARISSG
jgi:hypothetical protein